MKTIQIKAEEFFDMLKNTNTSMWEVFAQLIQDEPQLMLFLSHQEEILFRYELPTSLQELEKQRAEFGQAFAQRLIQQQENAVKKV